MPYIKQINRKKLDGAIRDLAGILRLMESDKGDLNYCITKLIIHYVETKGKSYSVLSDVTGVLNDAKVEFERRVVAPYEDEKIIENGDAYPHPRRGIK